HNISVTVDSSGHFLANVVQGQMYQIFENLISNSVYWLTHHYSMLLESGAGVTDFSPLIEVIINAESREVVFRDNGPGIRVTDASKVFDPFFSKKPSGRGIGPVSYTH
ncbi:ATP-binding protein, partial [Pseudomonas aeruginosa]|uniref:ATP-binding protein n=1 Tax=Pseudomonas aeruginosa TaxID=287 RepID=UPI001F096B20